MTLKSYRLILISALLLFTLWILAFKPDYDLFVKVRQSDVPQDMAYFEGNDSINAFYIGRTEECNRNYMIYLEWLRRVYASDYPAVLDFAIPDTQKVMQALHMNDAMQSYFSNPAFKYYPVAGVSWLQANEYCKWKTDRINEMILIREGVLKFNPAQLNEDNFNSEAYLEKQYEGLVRAFVVNDDTHDTTPVEYRHHILMPAFRLPTEAEWNYALAHLNEAVVSGKKEILKHNFMDWWYDKMKEDYGFGCVFLNVKSKSPGALVNPVLENVNNTDDMMNFDDNVNEWVYDIEGLQGKDKNNLLSLYQSCNQPEVRLSSDQLPDKDFMGRMTVQYLYDDSTGLPVKTESYKALTLEADTTLVNLRSPLHSRIIRGGNNKVKSISFRKALMENETDSLTGFRCAMTLILKKK